MKKKIISFTFGFIVGFIVMMLASCKSNEVIMGTSFSDEQIMYNDFNRVFTKIQFDSICSADNISRNLVDWDKKSYVDYETGTPYSRYMLVKTMDENIEIIYILMPKGENYKIEKRIVR